MSADTRCTSLFSTQYILCLLNNTYSLLADIFHKGAYFLADAKVQYANTLRFFHVFRTNMRGPIMAERSC
jgi:hypothetical protein